MRGRSLRPPRAAAPALALALSALLPAASPLPDPGPPAMIAVEGGAFDMGMNDGESYVAEEPVHRVSVSSFLLGEREVTVGEFAAFARDSGYVSEAERAGGAWVLRDKVFVFEAGASWRSPGFAQAEDEPALCVSWNDAVAYCNALSAAEGLAPAYSGSPGGWRRVPGSAGYRLPTEAEWEYAASGGKAHPGGRYPGRGQPASLGWELENSGGRSHPVARKAPNGLGIYDLCGNAWEWCDDYFAQRYYESSPASDPPGPASGATKSARGGSWASRPRNCRVTQRYAREPDASYSYMGFRLARSVPAPEALADPSRE